MWIVLIVALITFLTAKKKGASTGEAMGYAALAGGATYAVEYGTDWGKENLLPLNGKIDSIVTGTPEVGVDGTKAGSSGGNGSLGNWLPIAGAAVGGAVLGGLDPKWLWIGAALAAVLIISK